MRFCKTYLSWLSYEFVNVKQREITVDSVVQTKLNRNKWLLCVFSCCISKKIVLLCVACDMISCNSFLCECETKTFSFVRIPSFSCGNWILSVRQAALQTARRTTDDNRVLAIQRKQELPFCGNIAFIVVNDDNVA